jgi:hypothetical protein
MENFEDGAGAHAGESDALAVVGSQRLAGGQLAAGTVPDVPGYVVGRELGRGGSASVWLVTEELTHRDFAVKCFVARTQSAQLRDGTPQPGGPGTEDAVRREVRILSALNHQHLVKAQEVVRLGGAADGGLGVIMDYAAGGSLGQLVTSRGSLSVGETVTVLTPLAQVLSYLHGNGFMHSDVSPGNVLFSAHGKPLLADLGVARMVGDAADHSANGTEGFFDPAPVDAVRAGLQPERDVYSLAAIGWYCLTGRAPEVAANRPPLPLLVPGVPAGLASALEAGLKEDRRGRPTAAEFAAAVYRSAEAAPVDLAGSVHPTVLPQLLTRRNLPESPRARRALRLRAWGRRIFSGRKPARRRPRRAAPRPAGRRGWMGRIAVVLACAAMGSGWFMTDSRQAVLPPSLDVAGGSAVQPLEGIDGTAVPGDIRQLLLSQNPAEAARGLAWLRSTAFSSGKLELLEAVNVGNSAAALADARISSRLRESGHVLTGFDTTLTHVEVAPGSTGTRAVVDIRAVTSAYQETDSAGTAVAAGPAGAEQRLRLVMTNTDRRWRIQEILPPG